MDLSYFDAIWYTLFPPTSPLEVVIDQLPDIVIQFSKTEPLLCGFLIIVSLGLTFMICVPFFGGLNIVEYIKFVVTFPITVVVGTLVLWLPIKIFGRLVGYIVYPFEWIASFVLGILYSILDYLFGISAYWKW